MPLDPAIKALAMDLATQAVSRAMMQARMEKLFTDLFGGAWTVKSTVIPGGWVSWTVRLSRDAVVREDGFTRGPPMGALDALVPSLEESLTRVASGLNAAAVKRSSWGVVR